MKILVISNLYKPYARGGAEMVANNMVNGLVSLGHEITTISTRPYFKKCFFDDGNCNLYWPAIYYNLRVIPYFLRIFWHFFDTVNFISYFRLLSLLRREKFDLVITNNLKGIGMLIPLAIKKTGIKHYHILHDVQLFYPSGLIYYKQEKKVDFFLFRFYAKFCALIFGSPTKVFSPSKWLLNMHQQRGFFPKSKLEILYNPILDNKSIEQRENENKKFRFVFAGQVAPHKGILVLVNAFKLINSKECELVIIGDGPQMSEVKEACKDCENIILLGQISNVEVQKEMSMSNCLVMPSLCYENSPMVISEAAKMSLPIIASNIGGIGEMIEIYGGVLVIPGDINSLSAAMTEMSLYPDRAREIGSQAQIKTKEMSFDSYLKRLLENF